MKTKNISSNMEKIKDLDISFGQRRVQKVRLSYIVVIPKLLVHALGIKKGDKIEFVLSKKGRVFLPIEGEGHEAN